MTPEELSDPFSVEQMELSDAVTQKPRTPIDTSPGPQSLSAATESTLTDQETPLTGC